MNYKDQYKHPKWQRKRLQIMKRDSFSCKKCGDTETTLHVHHKEYFDGRDVWDYENKYLVTLCEDCHRTIERFMAAQKINDPYFIMDLKCVRIYKSSKRKHGNKIIFLSYKGLCLIVIYDKQIELITFFIFDKGVSDILKLFNFTKRNQPYG